MITSYSLHFDIDIMNLISQRYVYDSFNALLSGFTENTGYFILQLRSSCNFYKFTKKMKINLFYRSSIVTPSVME